MSYKRFNRHEVMEGKAITLVLVVMILAASMALVYGLLNLGIWLLSMIILNTVESLIVLIILSLVAVIFGKITK